MSDAPPQELPPAPTPRLDRPALWEKVVRTACHVAGGNQHAARKWCTQWYPEVPGLKRFAGVGRGRPCVIICNGPSLNKLDLSLLANVDTFAVNAFFLKFDEIAWRPTYYTVEDRLVAADRAPWINKLRGFAKFFPLVYRDVLTPDEDTTYLNFMMDYTDYADFPEFSTNAARCVWVGGTVTYINLQLAYYMEYDPVVLIGADHNYVVNQQDNKIVGHEMTSKTEDVNHFHKDYFGKGFRWHDPNVERMERAYVKARRAFDAAGRKVLNATAGGHLEVFERAEYEGLAGAWK